MTHEQEYRRTVAWLQRAAIDAKRRAYGLTGLDDKIEAHRLCQELGRILSKLRAQIFRVEDMSTWCETNGSAGR